MTLFVNPVVGKFGEEFIGKTSGYIVKIGKQFIRSNWGKSGADRRIERHLLHMAPNTKRFNEAKPLLTNNKPVFNLGQHEVSHTVPTLSPACVKLNRAKRLRAQFNELVKRDERGVIVSSEAECNAILEKLDPDYLRITQAAIAHTNAVQEKLMRLPANSIMRKMSPISILNYKTHLTAKNIVCRYGIMLDNDINSLSYACNSEAVKILLQKN